MRMPSSPGLAATAVSALLLTGVPALTAPALADAPPILAVGAPTWGFGASGIGPGSPAEVNVSVQDSQEMPLPGVEVIVTVDNSAFLTPVTKNADPSMADLLTATGAEGDPAGSWASLGTSHTYTTDANGEVVLAVDMERNPDFDDDGTATSHLSVTALGQSETTDVTFNAGTVLNPGHFTVTPTASTQPDLPEVQTRERAAYDVVALDQFGNRTSLTYGATDNSPDADLAFTSSIADESSPCVILGKCRVAGTTQYTNEPADLVATGRAQTEQAITVTPDARPAFVNGADQDPGTPGVQCSVVTNGSAVLSAVAIDPITWYVIDYKASEFTLTPRGGATHPTASSVTEDFVALDQRQQPIRGLGIDFFADNVGQGTPTAPGARDGAGTTDADGRSTFTFYRGASGPVSVAAKAYEDRLRDTEVGSAADMVTFVGATVGARLRLSSHGRRDVARVISTPEAKGAKVHLYRVHRNGVRTFVATRYLNRHGVARFRVRDHNGHAFTRYVATIGATDGTQATETPIRRKR
jgi:hypothetical protein